MKKYKYYILLEQSTRPNEFHEWKVIESPSYMECLKAMKTIEKGYISASNEDDENIRYSSDDLTDRIVKTKGWK